jgi:hypothetical protein
MLSTCVISLGISFGISVYRGEGRLQTKLECVYLQLCCAFGSITLVDKVDPILLD